MRQLERDSTYVIVFAMQLIAGGAGTGLTVDIQLSKAGGAFADPAAGPTTATEISDGLYSVTLAPADTDTLGDLVVLATEATCIPTIESSQVILPTWHAERDAVLRSLTISATGVGPALHIIGNDDHAILLEQFGTHEAFKATAADASAMKLVGGTSGFGLSCDGGAGDVDAVISEVDLVNELGSTAIDAVQASVEEKFRKTDALLASRIAQEAPRRRPGDRRAL